MQLSVLKRCWTKIFMAACCCVPQLLLAAGNADQASPPGGFFTVPPTDYSWHLLGQLFGNIGTVLVGHNQLAGTLFSVFNVAILALAGMVLLYTLFVSTLNSAHDGSMLGQKWNSMWVPLRAVMGMGLLVPVVSGQYSLIQVAMMWIVVQGIGAADTMWSTAVNYFQSGGTVYTSTVSPVLSNYVDKDTGHAGASGVLQSLVCSHMLQAIVKENPPTGQLAQQQRYTLYSPATKWRTPQGTIFQGIHFPGSYETGGTNLEGICGTVFWSSPAIAGGDLLSSGSLGSVASTAPTGTNFSDCAHEGAFTSVKCGVNAIGDTLKGTNKDGQPNGQPWYDGSGKNNWFDPSFHNNWPGEHTAPGFAPKLDNTAARIAQFKRASTVSMINELNGVAQKIAQYGLPKLQAPNLKVQNALLNAAESYAAVINPLMEEKGTKQLPILDTAKEQGWIMAGSWYYTISVLTKANSPTAYLVQTNAPNPTTTSAFPSETMKSIMSVVNNSNLTNDVTLAKATAASLENTGGAAGSTVPLMVTTQLGGLAFEIMKYVTAGLTNIAVNWNTMFATPGNAWSSNLLNPVVKIAQLGNMMIDQVQNSWINGSMWLMVIGALAGAFPCSAIAFSSVLTWLIPIIFTVMISLLTIGIVFAFYVPLVPYMLFTFGAMGWMIGVIEAMVAAPIVALGVIHPEGQHDVFGKAEPAMYLMINLFLRPTLMIIGLLMGMTLSYVAVNFLNMGIGRAFQGVMQFNGVTNGYLSGFFKPIGAMIIYTIVLVIVVNKTFALVNIIPDKVLRWIEGGAAHASAFGEEAAGMEQQASQQSKAAAGEMGRGVGEGMKGASNTASEGGQMVGKTVNQGAKSAGKKLNGKGGGGGKSKGEKSDDGGDGGGGGDGGSASGGGGAPPVA